MSSTRDELVTQATRRRLVGREPLEGWYGEHHRVYAEKMDELARSAGRVGRGQITPEVKNKVCEMKEWLDNYATKHGLPPLEVLRYTFKRPGYECFYQVRGYYGHDHGCRCHQCRRDLPSKNTTPDEDPTNKDVEPDEEPTHKDVTPDKDPTNKDVTSDQDPKPGNPAPDMGSSRIYSLYSLQDLKGASWNKQWRFALDKDFNPSTPNQKTFQTWRSMAKASKVQIILGGVLSGIGVTILLISVCTDQDIQDVEDYDEEAAVREDDGLVLSTPAVRQEYHQQGVVAGEQVSTHQS